MKNWQDKKVIVIGAARQGLAATRFLAKQGANVILTDSHPNPISTIEKDAFTLLGVDIVFGNHPDSLLIDADYLCVSGGVPLDIPFIKKAKEKNIQLTNDAQLFFENTQAAVIGITGSAGKTTTTTLIGSIAQANKTENTKVWIGGNIGNPLIDDIDLINTQDNVVMELSSFQLELMNISPKIALVLNITPNHLDRHKTMEAYTAAKANILNYQNDTGIAILNRDDSGSVSLAKNVQGELITFGMNKPADGEKGTFIEDGQIIFSDQGKNFPIMPTNEIKLAGKHNQMNVLAATATSLAAGFSMQSIVKGIRKVEGVPHRLELIRTINGVRWYNDSIATAPERVLAALEALKGPLVLLLGGRDKNLPWNSLVDEIGKRKPKVILFGEGGMMIEDVLRNQVNGNIDFPIYRFNKLDDAIQEAFHIAEKGEAVLLSPGGTSYDAFKDFEERGNLFRSIVEAFA